MRVYRAVVYVGSFRQGLMCKGNNKVEAAKDAIRIATNIWPVSGRAAKVGGLRWLKGLDENMHKVKVAK